VLLPEASESFRALGAVRHRSIHFDPATDRDDRPLAMQALNHLNDIVSRQFGALGTHPWFISRIAGASYIRKAAEAQPFVRRVYIQNCQLVGPCHTISAVGSRFEVSDAQDYEDREITDEEFRELLGAEAGAQSRISGNRFNRRSHI
jgi:hypothetical protein